MPRCARWIVGADAVSDTVGALSTPRVTSFPVVHGVKTVVGRAATVTKTLMSVWSEQMSVATTPCVSILTAHTSASVISGINALTTVASVCQVKLYYIYSIFY